MKKAVSIGLAVAVAGLLQAGCSAAGPPASVPSRDLTPYIVGSAVATLVPAALFLVHVHREKARCALTPGGAEVLLLAHDEAPAEATFLADIQTGPLSRLDYVKNDLRNQTALRGGDLVVLDDIQQIVLNGQTSGFVGIGRAYVTKR